MKKVAIITWFHWHNFGTALQLAALYKTIQNLGFEPNVIDYIPKTPVFLPKPPTFGSVLRLLRRCIGYAVKRLFRISGRSELYEISAEAENKYSEFIGGLNFTAPCPTMGKLENLNGRYDAFVCGSDQIWSPSCFDDKFFLSFVHDDGKKIAYAPSIGLPRIDDENVKGQMRELISKFQYLSVRERKGAEMIDELCGKTAEDVLDPTLLLAQEQWDKELRETVSSRKEKYILCYFLGYRKAAWKHVEKISQAMKMNVKVIPIYNRDPLRKYETIRDIGPREFVGLLKNAAYVCTDSFHATAFSAIYGIPFSVYERFSEKDSNNQNCRVYNLLSLLGLNERLVTAANGKNAFLNEIDWLTVNEKLAVERARSLRYLGNALSAATKSDTEMPGRAEIGEDKQWSVRQDGQNYENSAKSYEGSVKVSVIVPMYNVEKYVGQLIESVQAQTHTNFELLLVDDGSPDHSGEIADSYAEKDERIKVIHSENGGVSSARNKGLDLASGQYVTFIDGDDFVSEDYIEYLLRLAVENDAGFSCSAKAFTTLDMKQTKVDNIEILSPAEATEFLLGPECWIGCWNKIYRKSLLDDDSIRFNEALFMGEGLRFITTVAQKANRIAVGHRKVYFYRLNHEESATFRLSYKKYMGSVESLDLICSDLTCKTVGVQLAWQCRYWATCYNSLLWFAGSPDRKTYREQYKRLIKNTKSYAWNMIDSRYNSGALSIVTWLCPVLYCKILSHKQGLCYRAARSVYRFLKHHR